jgi:hypothetical protein
MRKASAIAFGALFLAIGLPAVATAAGSINSSTVVGGGGIFDSGIVRTDGTLTVGGQETLYVKRIPTKPKLRLAASVYPPAVSPGPCVQFPSGFCVPQPLFRAPGTPRLRVSHKGRGRLTFVMPPGVEFENFSNPLQDHLVPFTNGEKVEVDIEGTFKRNRHSTVGGPIADTEAVVEVPPPPPSP